MNRLKNLIKRSKEYSVTFEGSAQDIDFYIVTKEIICQDCKGKKRMRYGKSLEPCYLCLGKGNTEKTDRVEVKTESGVTKIECSCTHCSTRSLNPEAQCSTKLSVILYLSNEKETMFNG